MSRIHPTENRPTDETPLKEIVHHDCPSILTVWKKSSMSFQGTDGFTVFNHEGKLVFRVDNYSRTNRCLIGGLVLMDGAGRALMTLRPQILSMQYQWHGFKGEDKCRKGPRTPVFSMRRRSVLGRSNDEAEVFMGNNNSTISLPDFRIEGSFRRRRCRITGPNGEKVAEISRKKVNTTIVLSDDVFNLVVQPGFDSELIMAFVIIMDRIYRKPFTPILCT
ncbi:LURP1-like domain [Macleaya cordata]|uniref:LURP1-like domain n=1 Tax=Macleaya cordata TaxID=56857 RepID=A0A200R358_MACCD|nr:LURP1-like domain [Macleaya cordata]